MPNRRLLRNPAKLITLGVLGGARRDVATFGVTTTGAQTLTIAALTVSAATTVDWGDGLQDVYTGSRRARRTNLKCWCI